MSSAEAETSSVSVQHSGRNAIIAVLLASIVVVSARLLADHYMPRPEVAVAATGPSTDEVRQAQQAERAAEAARLDRQRREQDLIEQDRLRRERNKEEALRAHDEAAAAAQAEVDRKEAAWGRFFHPAPKCNNPSDDATRVDCTNQYLRARQRFDKQYADGKLK